MVNENAGDDIWLITTATSIRDLSKRIMTKLQQEQGLKKVANAWHEISSFKHYKNGA